MRLKDFVKANGGTIGETLWLPPDLIEIEPGFNPRERTPELDAHIREIADSILADGYDTTQHLIVKYTGERVLVRDGHCRLEAVRLAISEGATVARLPLDPMPGASNEIDDSYLVLSTQTKKPLTPLEYAAQVRRLIRQGQTEAEIARRLGQPLAKLRRAIELAEAPAEVRQLVRDERISPSEAVNVVRRNGVSAGAVMDRAAQHARSEGRERIRPRDVAAVERPRTEPVSLCSLVVTALREWHAGEESLDFQIAMEALDAHPLVIALMRKEAA